MLLPAAAVLLFRMNSGGEKCVRSDKRPTGLSKKTTGSANEKARSIDEIGRKFKASKFTKKVLAQLEPLLKKRRIQPNWLP